MPASKLSRRVLVIAPVGQDAAVMAGLLNARGIQTEICAGPAEACRKIIEDAGALLLTEEALELPQASDLLETLRTQPPWSELPIIILTSGGESRQTKLLEATATAAGTVTLLERPLRAATMLRSVEVALRSRRRQYQVRDLLEEVASREAQLQTELGDTKLLQSISAELIQHENVAVICKKIVDAAAAIMRSEFASMQQLHPERGKGELRLLAFKGFNPQAAKRWLWVRADSPCACGAALRTGRRVIVPDVEQCDFLAPGLETYLHTGIHAVQSTPLLSRNGRILGVISTHWRKPHTPPERDLRRMDILARQAADILERKQAETTLRRAKEFDEAVMNNMGEGLYTVDSQGLVTFMNPAAERLFGWKLDELRGRKMHDLTHHTHPDGSPFPAKECPGLQVLHKGKTLTDHEDVFIRKDGTFFDVVYSSSPIRENGGISGLAVVFRDITERKRAEKALWEQAQQQQNLYRLTDSLSRAASLNEVYDIALFSIVAGLHCSRASILFFDDSGVIRFAASCGLSPAYRKAVEGHSPWPRDHKGAQPICIGDLEAAEIAPSVKAALRREEIRALAFIPLEVGGKLIGKFMAYYDAPHVFTKDELNLALTIARQLGFGVERKRGEAALRENKARLEVALDAAQAAARAKDQFIATVSHELRTPLTPVLITVSMLQRNQNLPPPVQESLHLLERNLQLEVKMVNDLLDLSRIVNHKLDLDLTPCDLHEIIRRALDVCLVAGNPKKLKVVTRLSAPDHQVRADATRLQQVFWNLVQNAIKFTPAGGTITLSSRNVDGRICVAVADTGCGIKPALLEKVFEPFAQAPRRSKESLHGLGLGLAIARRIVETHGGTLVAGSKGRNRGAVFTVSLRTVRADGGGSALGKSRE